MTQKDLGDAIGVRHQQIQKYECATNLPLTHRLLAIAAALRCDLVDLLPERLPPDV